MVESRNCNNMCLERADEYYVCVVLGIFDGHPDSMFSIQHRVHVCSMTPSAYSNAVINDVVIYIDNKIAHTNVL